MPRQFEITTRQGEIPLASNITASLKFNEVIYNFNGSKAALINNTSIFIIELDRNNMYEITNPDMTRIKSIAFSKDNRYLVALGYHQLNTRSTNITAIVKEYDLSQQHVNKIYVYTIQRNEFSTVNPDNKITLTDDGNYFAFMTKSNTISIYNLQNGDNVTNFHEDEILFYTFLSSDYTDLIVNYHHDDNCLSLFNFQNREYIHTTGIIDDDRNIKIYELKGKKNKR